jgi:putative lipoprotein
MVNTRHFRRFNDKEINMTSEPVRTISGTVHYLERIALPANSTLQVTLLDVSNEDAVSRLVAGSIYHHVDTAGLDFTLQFREGDVLAGHRYAISAQIKHNDQLVFITTTQHQVELDVDYVQGQEVLVSRI